MSFGYCRQPRKLAKRWLVSLLFLLCAHPVFVSPAGVPAAPAITGSAPVPGAVTNAQLTGLIGNAKLLDAPAILAGLQTGQPDTAVIVTLAPTTVASALALQSQLSPRMSQSVNVLGAPTYYDLQNLDIRNSLRATVTTQIDQTIAQLAVPGLTVTQRFSYQFGFAARVTPAVLTLLAAHPGVIRIEQDGELTAHLAQGIPLMGGSVPRSTYNGSGISIAICDTGIDTSHPMLGGNGTPGATPFNSKVIGGYDTGDNDADPRPNRTLGQSHGTECAGIAAGNLGTNGDYIGGVAPAAKLYAIKISTGNTGSATSSAMIAGWEWAVTHQNDDPANPIRVISTSFGGGSYTAACDTYQPAMTTAAANAVAAGITLFASSGNDGFCGSIAWPACISSVNSVGAVYDANIAPGSQVGFCVAATSCATKQAYPACSTGLIGWEVSAANKVPVYSNTASCLTLLAPSHYAYTTDIVGAGGASTGDYDPFFGGTSAASPYAAGAAAVLQSAALAKTGAFLTPAQVQQYLTANGDAIADGKVAVTKPRINLARAVNALPAPAPAVPAAPSNLSITATSPFQINLRWTDNSNNETGFKIERKTGAAGTWAQITTLAVNATSYSSTGLTAATAYYYRVRAYNTAGNSGYSNESTATTPATYTLTVSKAGTGSGTASGGGTYTAGAAVTLSAKANPGSALTGWSPSPCAASFAMPANNLTCVATFTLSPVSTTTTVASSLNPALAGAVVKFTAKVTPATATGSVAFMDGTKPLGTGVLSRGVASFSTKVLVVGSHSITAVLTGTGVYTGSTSATLTQSIKGATVTTVASDRTPAAFGQTVTFTATVTPSAATGVVTFKDGATVLGTGTLLAGRATFSTAALTVGTHRISAAAAGDSLYNPSTSKVLVQTVGKVPTQVTAGSGLNPASFGQSVTFTAMVTPPTAAGTVTFKDGAAILGRRTLAGGTATLSSTALRVGSHRITAVVTGTGVYLGATSPALSQTVNKAATTTTLASSLNPSIAIQIVKFTATVTPATATGRVTFKDGATPLGVSVLSRGVASFSTARLAAGSHSITAVLTGTGAYNGSSAAALTQTVTPVSTGITLASSLSPATAGAAVRFTARVTPATATGRVTFLDGTTALGTVALLRGVASFSTKGLAVGSHSISAVLTGTGFYTGASSAPLIQSIKGRTLTTVAADRAPATFRQAVTFTATVTPSAATGVVTFKDGATVLGTGTLLAGRATFSTAALTVGTHRISAAAAGDSLYNPSTSKVLVQTVGKVPTQVTAGSGLNPASFGQSVTFTAMVTPPTAAGTVTFKDGAAILGRRTLAGGTATLSSTALRVGSHRITAVLVGTGFYTGSTSATVLQQVN